MAGSISNDFAIANGIAAYALIRETLAYFEALGVPHEKVIGITMAAHAAVQSFGKVKTHPALPIAAELLQDAVRQLQATTAATH